MSAAPAPAGESFPPRARLRRKSEFERVFRLGVRRGTRELRLVVAENEVGYPRLGLAVSRRVGNAVVRNRLKRWLREIFRRHRDRLDPRCDVVVIPQPGAALLSYETLMEQFLRTAGEGRTRRGEP